MYTWEHTAMSNPKGSLEFGFKFNKGNGIWVFWVRGKFWEGNQEKYGRRGLFKKGLLCRFQLVLSPQIGIVRVLLFLADREGAIFTDGNFHYQYKRETCTIFLEIFMHLLVLNGFQNNSYTNIKKQNSTE